MTPIKFIFRCDQNSIEIYKIKTNDFVLIKSAIWRTKRALNIYVANVKIFPVNYFIGSVRRMKSLLALCEISKRLLFHWH